MASTDRRLFALLALPAAGALATSATAVAVSAPRHVPFGDTFYFHFQAQLLVAGKGWFVDPFRYFFHVQRVPSASHPPLWTLVLALADELGIRSYLSQLLMACVVDAAAVYMAGIAGTEAAGRRAGLLAASIAAVYPGFWLNPGTGLSETLLLLVVASVAWAALRYHRAPTWPRACMLGALGALAALDRSEQILLLVLVLPPVVLIRRMPSSRVRLAHAGAGLVVAAVVLAPWIGFNLSRMQPPEYLSSELGSTLAGANCGQTYSGPLLGSWSNACALAALGRGNESQQDAHQRSEALHYMGAHAGRLPAVISVRVGRQLGLFRPFEQLSLDRLEGRPIWPMRIGLVAWWVLSAVAVIGAAAVWRKGPTLVPFAGILGVVVVVAAATYGSTRLRTPLEVVVVILAAVGIDSSLPQHVATAHIGSLGRRQATAPLAGNTG